MKSAADIVAEIDDVLRDIWKHMEDPENLSRDILKLSVLNGGLGNWLAEAQDLERRMEAAYKHDVDARMLNIRETEKNEKGHPPAIDYAKAKATIEKAEQLDAWLDGQHQVTVLRLKRQDTDQAIDAARSRLSLIKQDIRQATNQGDPMNGSTSTR